MSLKWNITYKDVGFYVIENDLKFKDTLESKSNFFH